MQQQEKRFRETIVLRGLFWRFLHPEFAFERTGEKGRREEKEAKKLARKGIAFQPQGI
jgi:hypothetical protein